MSEPAGVLVDLDGTLTDRHLSIEKYAADFLGNFRSKLAPTTQARLTAALIDCDGDGYDVERFENMQVRIEWRDAPAVEIIADHWSRRFSPNAVARPGALAALQDLRQRGCKLAIVTNGGTAAQNVKIGALGLESMVDSIVISEAEGVSKPAAEIFEIALRNLALPASRCWFVGDNPEKDVAGAGDAGLTAVWFVGDLPWPVEMQRPSFSITNWAQFGALLRKGAQ